VEPAESSDMDGKPEVTSERGPNESTAPTCNWKISVEEVTSPRERNRSKPDRHYLPSIDAATHTRIASIHID